MKKKKKVSIIFVLLECKGTFIRKLNKGLGLAMKALFLFDNLLTVIISN